MEILPGFRTLHAAFAGCLVMGDEVNGQLGRACVGYFQATR
jgi:hypothetical protein